MDGDLNRRNSLTQLQIDLLNDFQRDFPLCPRPFEKIAEQLGVDETVVMEHFEQLTEQKYISRLGAVVKPHQAGWSTLAALSVPEDELEEIAQMINACPGVNHNYERSHEFNLWFVITGADQQTVETTLDEIEGATGYDVLNLPLVEAYQLDLGFPIKWH